MARGKEDEEEFLSEEESVLREGMKGLKRAATARLRASGGFCDWR